ncbi:MAG: HYC_CC_PP family protein, partial [Paludibacter sp.]
MKKLFSILFAAMILLSGMHLSLATHICSGELSATKWSFSDEKASCGMEKDHAAKPADNSYTSDCCQDQLAFYSVDTNYNTSTTQLNEPVKQLLQVFYI